LTAECTRKNRPNRTRDDCWNGERRAHFARRGYLDRDTRAELGSLRGPELRRGEACQSKNKKTGALRRLSERSIHTDLAYASRAKAPPKIETGGRRLKMMRWHPPEEIF
jgi:hypothetical protein